MTQQDLLNRLETDLRSLLAEVRTHFITLDAKALRHRPNPEAWNILECIAHLNRYAADYIPSLNRAIHLAKARRWYPVDELRYTLRGRRLINRARPENRKAYKSKKRYNYIHQPIDQEVIKSFLIKGEQLLRILQAAREVDLNRPRVPKSGAWLGRYTLGNILEFLILHMRRHIRQASALLPEHNPAVEMPGDAHVAG